MRRRDREMDKEFATYVADKCEYAVISMIDLNNDPYSIPITIARIEDKIYFHSAKLGYKVDVLRTNSKVSLVCVGDTKRAENKFTTEYESAIINGTCIEVTENEEKIEALRAICERHTPKNMAAFDDALLRSLDRTAVYSITIEKITGKRKKLGSDGQELKFGKME